jgi:hypothetical protein
LSLQTGENKNKPSWNPTKTSQAGTQQKQAKLEPNKNKPSWNPTKTNQAGTQQDEKG